MRERQGWIAQTVERRTLESIGPGIETCAGHLVVGADSI